MASSPNTLNIHINDTENNSLIAYLNENLSWFYYSYLLPEKVIISYQAGISFVSPSGSDSIELRFNCDNINPTPSIILENVKGSLSENTYDLSFIKNQIKNNNFTLSIYVKEQEITTSSKSFNFINTKSQIRITCSTPDSQIYYTLDNSEPNKQSNLYSDIFEVEEDTTIKAKAYKKGYIESDIHFLTI